MNLLGDETIYMYIVFLPTPGSCRVAVALALTVDSQGPVPPSFPQLGLPPFPLSNTPLL